jgi:hypothetical protein
MKRLIKYFTPVGEEQKADVACIVVADFVTTNFHLKNKYNAKRKYD